MQRRTIHHTAKTIALVAVAAAVVLTPFAFNEAQTQPETRQPIVTNQFTTTSSGALQARAPGLYTQQAIAIQQGTLFPFDGNVPDNTPWVRETFDLLFLQFVDIIQQMVDTLNLLVNANSLVGGGLGIPGGGLGGILSNPLTSGGGSTPIQ